MRQIKFRAWQECSKTMTYDPYLQDHFNLAHLNENIKNCQEHYILMQYTGLRDKKRTDEYPAGQEVFEGDIYTWQQLLAKAGRQILKEHRTIVTWTMPELFFLNNRTEGGWGGIEVIGNVHEHPELIERSE